jgi:hypothetical protein
VRSREWVVRSWDWVAARVWARRVERVVRCWAREALELRWSRRWAVEWVVEGWAVEGE